jgi:hypothetical protein
MTGGDGWKVHACIGPEKMPYVIMRLDFENLILPGPGIFLIVDLRDAAKANALKVLHAPAG